MVKVECDPVDGGSVLEVLDFFRFADGLDLCGQRLLVAEFAGKHGSTLTCCSPSSLISRGFCDWACISATFFAFFASSTSSSEEEERPDSLSEVSVSEASD